MSSQILLGTGGSLLAMLVGWFLREIYDKVLRPIGDKATYKGALIEGEWETKLTFSDDSYNLLQIKLSRSGYGVVGKARCVEGHSKGHDFEFRGEYIPPLMTATYKDLSPHNTERGAAAFLLCKNGSEFRGRIVYSDDEQEEIFATECVMERATSNFSW